MQIRMTHFQTLPTCSLYSVSFKIKLRQPEVRLIQSSILDNSTKDTCFGRIQFSNVFGIALHYDAVIDCLIEGVQLTPAVDYSLALNRPSLRAWTQLTYFLSLPPSSVFPLHFAMSRMFSFRPVSKTPGKVSVISEWPSYLRTASGQMLMMLFINFEYHNVINHYLVRDLLNSSLLITQSLTDWLFIYPSKWSHSNRTVAMKFSGKHGRADTCEGDSGGPLLCKVGPKTGTARPWKLFGVTSFGDSCGKHDKYGVYTKVSMYIEWINTKMAQN